MDNDGEKNMVVTSTSNIGSWSLLVGFFGAILIINWIGILPNFPPFILGLIAMYLGKKGAKKDMSQYEKKYAKWGLILGTIAMILGLTQIIAWYIVVWTSSMID